MRTVTIREAKAHLSSLVEQAAMGEPFVISRSGKPLVKVVAVEASQSTATRGVGFMARQIAVPDDFDQMGRAEIEQLFYGSSE